MGMPVVGGEYRVWEGMDGVNTGIRLKIENSLI